MKKIVGIFFLCIGLLHFSVAQVTLKSGTKVYFSTAQYITSQNCMSNQSVNLEVYNDVIVDGKLLARAGSKAIGEVTECVEPKGKGHPGRVSIRAKSFTLIDGTEISVSGTPIQMIGKDNKTEACLAGVGGCFVVPIVGALAYFFVPGEECHVPVGTLIETTVSQDYLISTGN